MGLTRPGWSRSGPRPSGARFSPRWDWASSRVRPEAVRSYCPPCPWSSRISRAFSPASSPLRRRPLSPPPASFPSPFPPFRSVPLPFLWVPAVLTASITFHHGILQEGDLLDLPGRKSAGPLPMRLLSVPLFLLRPPSWEAQCPQPPLYLCTSPFRRPCVPVSSSVHPVPASCPAPCSRLSFLLCSCAVFLSFSVPLFPAHHCAVSPAPVLTPRCLPLCSLLFSVPSVPDPCCVSTLLSPYLLSQQFSHVLQRRISLLKFSQHLWGQVSTCVHRGQ